MGTHGLLGFFSAVFGGFVGGGMVFCGFLGGIGVLWRNSLCVYGFRLVWGGVLNFKLGSEMLKTNHTIYCKAEGHSQNVPTDIRRGFCEVKRNLYMNKCHFYVKIATNC